MQQKEMTFENLCEVIRESCGLHSDERITPDTQFQRDLGITGDDGDLVLNNTEKAFGVHFSRESFNLGSNEWLFDGEAPDVFGGIYRMLTKKPARITRSFTVGELFEAAKREQAKQRF